jgi:hypothetical protein
MMDTGNFWDSFVCMLNRWITESNAPTKQIFLGYKEGLYRAKQPFVVSLGSLGLQTEEDLQRYYFIAIYDFCDSSAGLKNIFYAGRRPQTIKCYAFALKSYCKSDKAV